MTIEDRPQTVAERVGGTPFNPVCKVVTATSRLTEDDEELPDDVA